MSNNSVEPEVIASREVIENQAETFTQDAVYWVNEQWSSILIAAGIAVGIFLLLHAIRSWGKRLCLRGDGVANWYSIVGRAIGKTSHFFIVMASIQLVVGYAKVPPLLMTTSTVLFTVAAVFQGAIWIRELIFGAIENRTRSDDYRAEGLASALGIIRLLISIVLFAIATVMVLGNVGVNVTGLIAGLGIGGIAIGLAAQGIFGDLIAALSIIFDRPFHMGQTIKYDATEGVVEAIGLKSTRLRSNTGELRIISNRQLLDKEIQNLSDKTNFRFAWIIGVAYETPPPLLARIPAMLKEVAEQAGGFTPRHGFSGFGPSSLDFELVVQVASSDVDLANAVRDKLPVLLLERFAAEGITIPYPTQTTFTAAPDGRMIMPYPDQPDSPTIRQV